MKWLLLSIFLVSRVSWSDGFTFQDDHDKLVNNAIIAIGTISKYLKLPASDDDTSNTQKQTVYQLGEYCFIPNYETVGFLDHNSLDGDAAMLLVDAQSNASVGILSDDFGTSTVKVRTHDVELVGCTAISRAYVTSTNADLKKMQLENEERVKALKSEQKLLDNEQRLLDKLRQ